MNVFAGLVWNSSERASFFSRIRAHGGEETLLHSSAKFLPNHLPEQVTLLSEQVSLLAEPQYLTR